MTLRNCRICLFVVFFDGSRNPRSAKFSGSGQTTGLPQNPGTAPFLCWAQVSAGPQTPQLQTFFPTHYILAGHLTARNAQLISRSHAPVSSGTRAGTIHPLAPMSRLVLELRTCPVWVTRTSREISNTWSTAPEVFFTYCYQQVNLCFPPISTMSIPSALYELAEIERIQSNSVDEWVECLECPRGNGPVGLLARVDAAWTTICRSSLLSPRAVRYLALEVVCLLPSQAFVPYLPTYRVICPSIVTFGRRRGLRSEPGQGILAKPLYVSQIAATPFSLTNLGTNISRRIHPR
jgi:hypothetical protein